MAQDLSALFPELWVPETLDILRDQLVMGAIVTRRENRVGGQLGDTVSVNLPGSFSANTLSIGGSVTVQTATTTKTQIVLNTHIEATTMIYDAESAKTPTALRETYTEPLTIAIAEYLEDQLQDEYANFTGTVDGTTALGSYGSDIADTEIATARRAMVYNKAMRPWSAVLGLKDVENLLVPPSNRPSLFRDPSIASDAPMAMQEAAVGRRLNIDFYESARVNANTSTSPDEYYNLLLCPQTIVLLTSSFSDIDPLGSNIYQHMDNGFSMRGEVSRSADKKGTQISIDALFGKKTVRPTTGVVWRS